MSPSKVKLFMDSAAISRSVTRLSHEIIEQNQGTKDVVLIGIQTRGEPLAKRMQIIMNQHSETEIPFGSVDITFHRDDFRERLVVPQVGGTNLPDSIDGKTVVLVDDVLYTGRTIRAAIETLLSFGRPARIQLAVLVDRGHREMPIRADYVGKNIPTHDGQHVNVLLKEVDGKDVVELRIYEEDASC